MIQVTRLNGKSFYINGLYVETVESYPDTAILLTNGKRYVVKETEEEVVRKLIAFYREIQLVGKLPVKEDEYDEQTD